MPLLPAGLSLTNAVVGGSTLIGVPWFLNQAGSFSDTNFGTDIQGKKGRAAGFLDMQGDVAAGMGAETFGDFMGQVGLGDALEEIPRVEGSAGLMSPQDELFLQEFQARHRDSLAQAGRLQMPDYADIAAQLGKVMT